MRVLKVMNKVQGRLIFLFFAIIILVGLGLLWGNYHVSTHKVAVRNEVERAITVSRLDNEVSFKDMQPGFFSGAGAGGLGMGGPQIVCKSVEQFLQFVPKNEPIYTAFQRSIDTKGTIDRHTITRVYWALIENRSGVWVYEDIYNYQEGNSNFSIEKYNNQEITFIFDPLIEYGDEYTIVSIFGIIVSVIFFIIGFWSLIPDIRYTWKYWKHL